MQILPETLILPAITRHGRGCVTNLLTQCREFGVKGMIVHGRSLKKSGVLDKVLKNAAKDISVATWEHSGGEPTLVHVSALLEECRKRHIDWIAAVGGGSVIDLAKVCAGLFNTKQDVPAYHNGLAIEMPGIPFIAAPTTAGTGSEATIVSVLINKEKVVKKSIRHPSFMARLVILDPDLLANCPKHVIAHSGMDAFTQAVESYTSIKSTWLSESLALKGLQLIASSLEKVYENPKCENSDDLLTGSHIVGIALSFSRLGVVHGLAHPLGVRYHFPHGLVCAVCLTHALEMNREAIGEKYKTMRKAIGLDILSKTQQLLHQFGITSPFTGKQIIEKEKIVEETLASGSTAANPKPIVVSDVELLLEKLFGGN